MWIPAFILNWWKRYQETKKRNELYARLDRNGEGKFNMKDHRKQIESAKRKRVESKRLHQEDLK